MVDTPRPVYSLRENNIFISYSQRNIKFARRLEQEIRKRGRDPWIDSDNRDLRDDIDPEDPNAWPYIEVGIQETDIFVFILSQDAIRSDRNCRELDLALKYQKPVFVIEKSSVDDVDLPQSLKGHNHFWQSIVSKNKNSSDIAQISIGEIAEEVISFHTYIRLCDRAKQWKKYPQDLTLAMRNSDLQSTKSWLMNKPAWSKKIGEIQHQYIDWCATVNNEKSIIRPDVFISYSRTDKNDFVEKLCAALKGRGINIWVDWENMPISVHWREELKYGIETTHTLVQVLSDKSVNSPYCKEELEIAISNKRRLIGVVWKKDFDSEDLLPGLRELNWIRFDKEDFDDAFHDLLEAINNDLDYLKRHSELEREAREWDRSQRKEEKLLRGTEILRARRILSEGKSKEQKPTPLQKDFVRASSISELRQLFMIALLLTGIVSFAFGFIQATRGEIKALVSSLDDRRELDALLQGIKAADKMQKGYNGWIQWTDSVLPAQSITVLQREVFNLKERNRLKGHTGRVLKVSFSPNKQLLASAGENGEIFLWKPTGERLAKLQGHGRTSTITSITFNPDSLTLASADSEGKIFLWDIRKPERPILTDLLDAARKSHNGRIYSITFSPGGNTLASAGEDGTVKLWTWNAASLNRSLKLVSSLSHNSPVYAISFSPLGDRLISGSADGHVRIWSRSNQFSQSIDISHGTSPVFSVDVSPDGKTFASGSEDGTIKLWHPDGSSIETDLLGHEGAVRRLVFSANGQFLALGGDDGIVRVWKRGKNGWQSTSLILLQGHQGAIRSVQFSLDNRIIATASEDDTVKIWSTENGALLDSLEGHTNEVLDLGFTTLNNPKDSELLLASASRDQEIRLWRIDSLLRKLPHNNVVFDVSFSSTGDVIASSSRESIRFWRNDDQNTPLAVAKVNKVGDIRSISFRAGGHPDIAGAERLASSGQDGAIRLWRFRPNGSGYLAELERFWLGGKGEAITNVKFHPKWVNFLASGHDDGSIHLWRDDGSPVLQPPLHQHHKAVTDISFQPDDGPLMASASEDGTIVLQPIVKSSATPIVIPAAQDEVLQKAINSLDFHPDGTKLVSGAASGHIRLWRDDGSLITEFAPPEAEQHIGEVLSVRFSPDGHLVVSSGQDGTIKIWTLDGKLISTLKGHRREVPRVNFAPLRNSDEPSQGITLASASSDYRVLLWSLPKDFEGKTLDKLLDQGCTLANQYLKTHQKENKEAKDVRQVCNSLSPRTLTAIELTRYAEREP